MNELSTILCTSNPSGGWVMWNHEPVIVSSVHGDSVTTPKMAFNRKELSALLGVSVRTICDLERRKLLRPSLATRKRIYSRSEVERFLNETSQ